MIRTCYKTIVVILLSFVLVILLMYFHAFDRVGFYGGRTDTVSRLKNLTDDAVGTGRYNNERNVRNGCKIRDVKLSEKLLPYTGLVSFPGSGNTWTRHLIQQVTGW